ncbi:MAG: CRISPR-associated protein Cas4 [Anaerolineales bacterium]|jgi:CRISPR-associated exonuclease Cas4
MQWIGLVLFMAGVAMLWISRRSLDQAGLPPGKVIYIDTDRLGQPKAALYDPSTNLTGRPDYLIREQGQIVPVEVKSGRAPFRPYDSHRLQLAAYCLLVEAVHGQSPSRGVIKYNDRGFEIPFTESLKNEVLDVLAEMRRFEYSQPDRSHEDEHRCRACGYVEVCDQALV